jgi:hypothetical protein
MLELQPTMQIPALSQLGISTSPLQMNTPSSIASSLVRPEGLFSSPLFGAGTPAALPQLSSPLSTGMESQGFAQVMNTVVTTFAGIIDKLFSLLGTGASTKSPTPSIPGTTTSVVPLKPSLPTPTKSPIQEQKPSFFDKVTSGLGSLGSVLGTAASIATLMTSFGGISKLASGIGSKVGGWLG